MDRTVVGGHQGCTVRLRRVPSLLCAALALTLAVASPVPALAQRAGTDIVAGSPLSAHKIARSVAPDIEAAAGILVGGDGRVLWARQPDAQRAMASTTKMMTALVALKHGELDRTVTVSKTASRIPDGAGLVPGERLTRRQLLGLMLVRSANDAAYALGESVGGSMPAFLKMMNDQAAGLGMRHTHYMNPHGLPAAGHYSSAADLATLARVVMSYPEFRRTVAMRSISVPAPYGHGRAVFGSTDRLLGSYPGLEGGKTGYTDAAGYCFVGVAERRGVTLVAVVLGTDSVEARFTQAAHLLDWGFRHVHARTLAAAGDSAGTVPLAGQPAGELATRIQRSASVSLLDLDGPVARRLEPIARLAAPVFAGQPIGEVTWTQRGRTIARVPVLAAATVTAAGESVGAVPVSDFIDETVGAEVGVATATPAFDVSGTIRRHLALDPGVSAPVAKGQRLGEITYAQNGRVVARVPVVAAAAVGAPGFAQRVATWWTRRLHLLLGGPQVAEVRIDAMWAQ